MENHVSNKVKYSLSAYILNADLNNNRQRNTSELTSLDFRMPDEFNSANEAHRTSACAT